VVRFAVLSLATLILVRAMPENDALGRLRNFCLGTLALVVCGAAISLGLHAFPGAQASLLRFYWFRLADIVVPATAALAVGAMACRQLERGLNWKDVWLAAAATFAMLHVGAYALTRPLPSVPRAFRVHENHWKNETARMTDYVAWRKACEWIADPAHSPPDARFLTPMMEETFKWYTGRSEVATLKDTPQDAAKIVAWWRTLRDIYGTGSDEPGFRWIVSLADRPPADLVRLGRKYEADYLLVEANPRLPFEAVYRNKRWIVYRLPKNSP
jgi:hypothetical protein